MNGTELIFATIFSYGAGYAIALGTIDMEWLAERWGKRLKLFFYPAMIISLLALAKLIELQDSFLFSAVFAAGFFHNLVKRHV